MAKTNYKHNVSSTKTNEDKRRQRQMKKQKYRFNRKARLIVRNLSFKTSEENFRKHFEPYGEVQEVNILKRPNGELVGCGFVQYKTAAEAAQALLKTNANKFLGRSIHVDWAVAKDTYIRHIYEQSNPENIDIKIEKDSDIDSKPVEIKEECISDTEIKSESNSDKDNKSEKESSDSESSEDSDEENDSEHNISNDSTVDLKPVNLLRKSANDATDGKTVFIKNVPFEAKDDDIRECMQQFGDIVYALVCVDKLTEHSKGTAFVRFKEIDSAQRCLSSGTELKLLGQILDPHPALSRDEVHGNSSKLKQKSNKDSRNLYLLKEGVVLAGTKAAEGVSIADMQKRLQLEQTKSQMLKNLNRFVSRYRLTIHNLPENYDDAKLRALCSVDGRCVREARVMRDSRPTPNNIKGTSKGFGFVSFTNHEDALATLRRLNNNPTIFSKKKRPIVAFSIEDKNAINTKIKRQQKSLLQNPNNKRFKTDTEFVINKFKKNDSQQYNNNSIRTDDNPETRQFSGIVAKPGPQKMRSKFGLKAQAKLHVQNMKKSKNQQKKQKKSIMERKADHIRQPKQKQSKTKILNDDLRLTKLINDYKDKLGQSIKKKTKWYE